MCWGFCSIIEFCEGWERPLGSLSPAVTQRQLFALHLIADAERNIHGLSITNFKNSIMPKPAVSRVLQAVIYS